MAKTRLVQERDSLAARVRALEVERNGLATQLSWAKTHQKAAEGDCAEALRQRDAMRTERDRALGLLKCDKCRADPARVYILPEWAKTDHPVWLYVPQSCGSRACCRKSEGP